LPLVLNAGISHLVSIASPWMWVAFWLLVVLALAIDLGMLRRRGAKAVSFGEALRWSLIWVGLALLFALGLWLLLRDQHGSSIANARTLEFLTGYVLEKSLAVDNIFVFLTLFSLFKVPEELRKKALVIGIIGAIVLRTVMILIGAWLIARFHWVLYGFGLLLIVAGIKTLREGPREHDFERNPILGLLHWRLPIVTDFAGGRLFVRRHGLLCATPMLLTVVMIGVTDVIFAVDSIPAIFLITSDPFIVLTSNVLAILGLRAIYFMLADLAGRFRLLGKGLALVMLFIGGKMLLSGIWQIPTAWSLAVIAVLIGGSLLVSVLAGKAAQQP
jgi:tellurite resistance protein TerC